MATQQYEPFSGKLDAAPQYEEFSGQLDGEPKKPAGAFRRVADTGLALAKGVIGVPEAAVGVADLVTKGRAGKMVEGAGVRFKDAKDVLTGWQSDEQHAADAEVANAKGFVPTLGAMVRNPSTIANAAAESAPSMILGGAASRGLLKVAPKMGGIAAGAGGEGIVAAGQNTEQVRQEDPNGLITGKQAAILGASGLATGGISLASGKLANQLGIGDVQTMLATGKIGTVGEKAAETAAKKGIFRKVGEGALVEGVGQELPQSAQEQAAQNLAQDKPIMEGVGAAGAQGMLVGGLTGAAGSGLAALAPSDQDTTSPPPAPAVPPAAPAQSPAAGLPQIDPSAIVQPGQTAPGMGYDPNAITLDRLPDSAALPVIDPSFGPLSAAASVLAGPDGVIHAPLPVLDQGSGEAPSQAQELAAPKTSGTPNAPSGPQQPVQPVPASETAGPVVVDPKKSSPVEDQSSSPIVSPEVATTKEKANAQAAKPVEISPQRPTPDRATPDTGAARNDALTQNQPAAGGRVDAVDSGQQPNGALSDEIQAAQGGNQGGQGGKTKSSLATVASDKPAADAGIPATAQGQPAAASVDDAAHQAATSPKNDLPEPTTAQKEKDNYKKGHARLAGMDLSIENDAGSERSGTDKSGRAWTNTLKHHYGYIKGTIGNDKDHVDAFVKPDTPLDYAGQVFVVDQIHPDTGKFDEHKVLIGFDNPVQARQAYQSNYAKGWKGLKAITAMPMAEFKAWVFDGPKNKPLVPIAQSGSPQAGKSPSASAADVAPRTSVATPAKPVPPVSTGQQGQSERTGQTVQPSPDDTSAPADPAAGKWYGTKEKADQKLAAMGLADTHEVVRDGMRFELRKKAGQAPVTQPATPATAPQVKTDKAKTPEIDRPATTQATRDALYDGNVVVLHRGTEFEERVWVEETNVGNKGQTWVIKSKSADSPVTITKGPSGPDRQWGWSKGDATERALSGIDFQATQTAPAAPKAEPTQAKRAPAEVVDNTSTNPGEYLVRDAGTNLARFVLKDGRASAIKYFFESQGTRDFARESIDAFVAKQAKNAEPAPLDKAARGELLSKFDAAPINSTIIFKGKTYEKRTGSTWVEPGTNNQPLASSYFVDSGMRDSPTPPPAEKPKKPPTPQLPGPFEGTPGVGYALPTFASNGAAKAKPSPSANTIFTEDAAAAARARLKAKLGRLNSGIDPETILDGITLAGYHIEKGARTFAAYAKAMIEDLGDGAKPYLKSWYMGVKYDPRASAFEGMSSAADVESVDVETLDTTPEKADTATNGDPNGNESTQPGVADGDPRAVPGAQSGRGTPAQPGSAPVNPGDVETREPANVGEPATGDAGATTGLRAASEDVGSPGGTDTGGAAGDGRKGAGGKGKPATRARSRIGSRANSPVVDPETVSPANAGPGDFVIDDPLKIVGGGQVARFDKNKAAIEMRNMLVEAGRAPTREEQAVLAGYTGWGSFGQELFQGNWAKPAPKPAWEARDQWLRENLGQKEWEGLQTSIINAHFTDPPTVLAMWDMVRKMGFTGGRTLEPSIGIGNFYGMMPVDMIGRSQRAGIELDPVTGSMAQMLYPNANIQIKGYEESKTPDNFYDLVIGNWPFFEHGPADRRYNRLSPTLHDYFFLKAIDQTRPGGLVVGITSKGTMDKKGIGARMEMARKAELVAAFRLPTGAFAEYAGTAVVTDIIILRKRDKPIGIVAGEGWIDTKDHPTREGTAVPVNEYFHTHPDHVVGEIDFGHGTTTFRPGLIVHRPDGMMDQLKRIAALVPEGAFKANTTGKHISYVANHTKDRTNSLVDTPQGLFVVHGEHLAPANEIQKYALKDPKNTEKREAELKAMIGLRQLYGALIDAERGQGDAAEGARTALRMAYESFVKTSGPISKSFGLQYLRRLDDPFYPAVAALESSTTSPGGKVSYRPAKILTESTMRGARAITSPTITDAFVLARNESVNPTIARIAEIAGKPESDVRSNLVGAGAGFEMPNGDFAPADVYLSGNVRAKLREARAALESGNQSMARNVEALEKVVPADIPYYKIETQMGATWVPPSTYVDFVGHMLGLADTSEIQVGFNAGSWKIDFPSSFNHRAEAQSGYGSPHVKFKRMVRAAIANQVLNIQERDRDTGAMYDVMVMGDDGQMVKATDIVNGKIADMRLNFGEWLWSDPTRRTTLEREYNEVRNAYATPQFDGSFLGFQGMALSLGSGAFNLREHQVNAIWRGLVTRKSLNAHEVGTGKTFTMGGIAVESRRYGIAKKPVLFAHNANSKSVAHEIQMMYPSAKVLYVDNLSRENIKTRMMQIANDDWDVIVMPHSIIDRIGFKEETLMSMAQEELSDLEQAAEEAAVEDGVSIDSAMWYDEEELNKLRSVTAKQLVKQRLKILTTIRKLAQQGSREDSVAFEDMGVDMLLVDEAHEFKKPPIATKMKLKGLQTATSNRSISMMFLTKYVRSMHDGGNVHLFTGTPITNTMTEVFHMMRYMMQEEMKDVALADWDGWFGSFAREVNDVELTSTGEYEAVTRLQSFINVPELRRMIGQYMDVVFSDDMPEMKPRAVNGKLLSDKNLTEAERAQLLNGRTEGAKDRPYKKVVNESSDMSPDQQRVFAEVQQYANRWKNMSKKDRKDAMTRGAPESPIIHEGIATKASFDVRLVDAIENAGKEGSVEMDPHPDSKAARTINNLLEIYRGHDQAAQVVFMSQGMAKSVTRREGPVGMKRDVTHPAFSTMHDMIERLVAAGVPREQIAAVDGSTSKDKRKEVADAMNSGNVRIVFGSTGSLGVGVNMQRNLRAMHHMDAPWMPGDLEQRNGRGHRQGNQWNTVLEYRYITDRLDGKRWQTLARKQKFITDFMKSKGDVRVIDGDVASEDQDDILSTFSEAAGDPRILMREKFKKNLEQLRSRERLHGIARSDAAGDVKAAQRDIASYEKSLAEVKESGTVDRLTTLLDKQRGDGFTMTIDDKLVTTRADGAAAIAAYVAEMRIGDDKVIGSYGDLALHSEWDKLSPQPYLYVKVGGRTVESNGPSLASLESGLRHLRDTAESDLTSKITRANERMAHAKSVAAEPFHMADKLQKTQQQLDDLESDISMNPVAPPYWLRNGAAIDTDVYRDGKPFTVTGHRWTNDGWYVVAADEKGDVNIPYMDAMDNQGMPLYEEHEFTQPTVTAQNAAASQAINAQPAPDDGAVSFNTKDAEEQARAAGFTMRAYRGVSKSNPFNDSGTAWLTTDREVAEAYAEEIMGYDDPDVLTVMVNPDKLPRHDASRLTDAQRESMQADEFGNPQAVGIYDRSDDHPLGGSKGNVTVIHAPREAVRVIDAGLPMFDRAAYTPSNGQQQSTADLTPAAAERVEVLNRAITRFVGASGTAARPFQARRLRDHAAIQGLASAFGGTVQGFRVDPTLLASQRESYGFFNGVYTNGTVYLNEDSQRPHLAVLGHELAHQMAKTDPIRYQQLVAAIRPFIDLAKYPDFAKTSVGRANANNPEKLREEFVGEVLSDGFMNRDFWRAVGKSNPSLLQRIVRMVGELLNKALAKMGYTNRTEQYLTDFNKVMQVAGEVMGEYGLKPPTVNVGGLSFNKEGQTDTPAFRKWFGKSAVVDKDGKPLVVYHGTNETSYTPRVTKAGSASAVTELKRMAEKQGIKEWGDVAAVMERWISSGIGDKYGVTNQVAEHARELTRQARSTEESPASVDLGFNAFQMPYGETELGSHFGTRNQATARGTPFDFYLRIKNPLRMSDLGTWGYQSVMREARKLGVKISEAEYDSVFNASDNNAALRKLLLNKGVDGIVYENEAEGIGDSYIAFDPEQIKSATGNRGTFDGNDPDIRFNTKDGTAQTLRTVTDRLMEATRPIGTVSLWDKTVGTQYNKSTKDADFKRVFDGFYQQTDDTAHYAIEAERHAPDVLMRLDNLGDVWKGLVNSGSKQKADLAAVSKALFANIEGEEGIKQVEYTDQNLRDQFNLTPRQIEMYRQVRKSVNTSIERLAQTYAAQFGQEQGMDIGRLKDMELADTVGAVKRKIQDDLDETLAKIKLRASVAAEDKAMTPAQEKASNAALAAAVQAAQQKAGALLERLDKMQEHADFLQENAYMPALRFGEYAVTVTQEGEDGKPETLHFEMFESQTAANLAAMRLRKEYPGADVVKSVLNKEQYAMFKGVSPETVSLFAKFTGIDKNEAVQNYIALAKSSRSVLMRQIKRKGIAGFSQDATRVLASFVTSNARQSAININQGAITDALASKALARKGDVQLEAQKLAQYMNNPLEEARRLRGFMFMHFMGGSVASALVNMTQPVMQTAPYLSQFAGGKTTGIMLSSARMAASGRIENAELRTAAKRAADEGITEPHEIHQLMADATGSALGNNLRSRAAVKAWGSFFSLAEAYNRRVTFIAAYQVAQLTNKPDPFEFARIAVIETQGLYGKVNRPNWARGAVGATLFTFKQFSIAYIEFLRRLPPKQKALALGILVLAAGLQGLPFAEDIEDIIDTIGQSLGYNTNSKKALRQFLVANLGEDLGAIMDSGIFTQTSVDVQGRLGMGNLLPGTAIFKPSETNKAQTMAEIAGPLGGVLMAAQKALGAAQRGDIAGAVQEMTPVAGKNFLKGVDMLGSGTYKDTRGYKVGDVTAAESFMKMLGLQPGTIAEKSRRMSEQWQDKSMVTMMESMIADQWAKGVFDKEPDQVEKARKTLTEWNERNPNSRIQIGFQQIRRRVQQMAQTREQRFIKTVPKELRAGVARELAQ